MVESGTTTAHALDASPVEVDVLDREEIERSGADNLAELLEESPGVRVTRSFAGVGVQLEGLDERYTLILVDGERATGRVGGVFDLRRLSTAQVERVEIARGAQSTLYGADAVAGVINIITRSPDEGASGEVKLRGGTRRSVDGTGRLDLGWKRSRYSLFGGHHRAAGWRASAGSIDTIGDSQSQSDVGLRADFGTNSRFRARLRSEYSFRDRAGVDVNDGGAVLDRRNRSEILQSSLRIEGDKSGWHWRLVGGHSYWRDQFAVDQRGDSELDKFEVAKDHLARLATQFDLNVPQQLLSVGAEAQLESLRTPRIGDTHALRGRGAVYVQDEWFTNAQVELRLLPGLRLDYDSRFGLVFTPRVALALRPASSLQLRASYGMGYRAPSFREMFLSFDNLAVGYVVRGNAELGAERAWSFNSDLSYRPLDLLELHARVYDVQIRDLITTDLVEGGMGETQRFGYVNIGTAATRGVGGGVTLSVRKLDLRADYEFLDARDLSEGRRLPGRARHSGQLGAGYVLGSSPWAATLSTRASITGPRTFGAALDGSLEETQAQAFVSWDVQVRQELGRFVTASLGTENLLDAGGAVNPMPPRTFFLAVESRFGPRACGPRAP